MRNYETKPDPYSERAACCWLTCSQGFAPRIVPVWSLSIPANSSFSLYAQGGFYARNTTLFHLQFCYTLHRSLVPGDRLRSYLAYGDRCSADFCGRPLYVVDCFYSSEFARVIWTTMKPSVVNHFMQRWRAHLVCVLDVRVMQ